MHRSKSLFQDTQSTITRLDFQRLSSVIESFSRHFKPVDVLEEKLANMRMIESEDTPDDLITMNSEVHCTADDQASSHAQYPEKIKLVYPKDANIDTGHVSVLTPLGVALLGTRAGMSIQWLGRDGEPRSLRVKEMLYQPEANFAWHL